MADNVIKTTARFQDTDGPVIQRPVIQIDHVHLPNTVRESIDGGRDNPFKPDGKIYKSADSIVDYYRYGPNQSRGQSPTDSHLLLNGQNEKRKNKNNKKGEKSSDGKEAKRPCWRRWLCCCCCCFNCYSNKADAEDEIHDKRTVQVTVLNSETNLRQYPQQYKSAPAVNTKTKDLKQTKIVVIRDDNHDNQDRNQPSIVNGRPSSIETRQEKLSSKSKSPAFENEAKEQTGTQMRTQSKSSKCVIS